MSINSTASFFRRFQKVLDQYQTNREHPERNEPHEAEIWETRDGRHHVMIVLKDSLRNPNDFTLTGIVIFPDNGGQFSNIQHIKYPRFTSDGSFTTTTSEHNLDLVRRIG